MVSKKSDEQQPVEEKDFASQIEEQAKRERALVDKGEQIPPANADELGGSMVNVMLNPERRFALQATRGMEIGGRMYYPNRSVSIPQKEFNSVKNLTDSSGAPYLVGGGS